MIFKVIFCYNLMKKSITNVILIVLILIVLILYVKTGFLQKNEIDRFDKLKWEYENNIVKGAEEFIIGGSSKTCWLLIHSYISTPKEMKELGNKINREFNDSVFAIRLLGHGELPSKIYNLTLDNWYGQVEKEFNNLSLKCEKINVVGSSIGGVLSLKLAQEKEFNNLYIINAYFYPSYRWYLLIDTNIYLKLFGKVVYYGKNRDVMINDPESLKKHIAYRNFPFPPIINSFKFFDETAGNLIKVDENILIQHSYNDDVADPEFAEVIFNGVSSEIKEIKWFERSNHILLSDYDKEDVIKNILDFERMRR